MALGQEDYGLFGLVGGLTAFVTFFNSVLSSAVGRFYAVNVGAAKKIGNAVLGLENCRKWFNTALLIHSVLPVALVAIGYPLGIWAIGHFLTVPPDRISACVWVWRFTCVACFFGMVNVPFQAMYTAKQEIAELTIYSFVTTTLNVVFVYYMVCHSNDWLARFSAFTCLLSVVPQLIIAIRAVVKYPECRLSMEFLWDKQRNIEIFKFAFARFWSEFAGMVSSQGRSILVNKYMGPIYNASMTVGNSVASHALSLSNSLSGALWPAVANKAGEGEVEAVRKLSFVACRVGTVLVLLFAIPLAIEIKEVLHIWLVNPPPFAEIVCLSVLLVFVMERMTDGYWMAIMGEGRGVMTYGWWVGWSGIVMVGSAWILFALGFGMWSVCIGLMTGKIYTVLVRLFVGRLYVAFSVFYWIRMVLIPIVVAMLVSLAAGLGVIFVAPPSWVRVIGTTLICELVFLPAIWHLVLEDSEKDILKDRILKKITVFKR